jgi:hypothetical protein
MKAILIFVAFSLTLPTVQSVTKCWFCAKYLKLCNDPVEMSCHNPDDACFKDINPNGEIKKVGKFEYSVFILALLAEWI